MESRRENEVAAASYTFAAALNELLLADDSLKHDLIGDFNQTAMSDNYCAREKAFADSCFTLLYDYQYGKFGNCTFH